MTWLCETRKQRHAARTGNVSRYTVVVSAFPHPPRRFPTNPPTNVLCDVDGGRGSSTRSVWAAQGRQGPKNRLPKKSQLRARLSRRMTCSREKERRIRRERPQFPEAAAATPFSFFFFGFFFSFSSSCPPGHSGACRCEGVLFLFRFLIFSDLSVFFFLHRCIVRLLDSDDDDDDLFVSGSRLDPPFVSSLMLTTSKAGSDKKTTGWGKTCTNARRGGCAAQLAYCTFP